ncbi:uncharacterized protein A4U43_C04F5890 [Asparagus officinalis]|uniref:Phytocyanin domain-containing protein n=1 Tax=Asparagus officinalis TaxID=4686 RepID=A0A5P1EYJ1_ASPOF|nr:early nodulin-like protein 1 [Asparagus officinalis]ONK71198.1 uncharacterized protein A4U43_C04F5890 [Asparagus officinalis]
MAFMFVNSVKLVLVIVVISSFTIMSALSLEFDVGGDKGWVVPPAKEPEMYNQWASKNRFNVGDIVRFKYKKDSVMVVTKEEYEKCKSTRPVFFSNNGNTEYKLNNSGTFYFISGVSGHCERGEKMILKVISHAPGTSPPSPDSSNVVAISALVPLQVLVVAVGVASVLF